MSAGERPPAGEKTRLLLFLASVVVTFAVNAAGLLLGVTIVLPHLFYLPIMLAAYWFPRRGTILSLAIAIGYLAMTLPVAEGDTGLIVSALSRAVVFVAIGAAISLLSRRLREQEIRYRGVFDNSEAGTLVIALAETVPRIEEANYVGATLLGTTASALIGEPMSRFLADPDTWSDLLAGLRSGKVVYGYETALRRTDGAVIQVLLSAGRLPDGRIVLTLVDITAQKNAEAALRKANAKLNMMGRLTRNDLIAAVSELLDRIAGGIREFDDPAVRRYIGSIEEDVRVVQRRAEITRDYQDLGLCPPGWQPLQKMIREVRSCLLLPGISVRPWVERLEVFADPMLDRVFSNLIENAARHGKNVSQVVITYQIRDDGLLIYVEDDGIGIPEPEKERIFEYNVDGGGGLGLFLVREVLSITGMTIAETGTPGEGARFEIHVPHNGYRIV